MEVTIGLAFAAGFISFISPCVLPLVPAYIGYMGGRVTNTAAAQASSGASVSTTTRLSTGLHSLFFVLGFSLVFVGLGLVTSTSVRFLGGGNIADATRIIGRAGGMVIIVFGLHFMGGLSWLFARARQHERWLNRFFSGIALILGGVLVFWAFDLPPSLLDGDTNVFNRTLISLPVFTALVMWLALSGAFTQPRRFWLGVFSGLERTLYADTRQQMAASGTTGFGGSTLMGVVFAAGWTPCIGPIYGAILTLAANGGSITNAGVMLFAYSLGLGLPFVATALAMGTAQGVLRGLNKHMGTIKAVSGVFLVAVGVLVASGQLQRLSQIGGQGELGVLSYQLEECFVGAVRGEVGWGQFMGCVNEGDDVPVRTAAALTGAVEAQTVPTGAEIADDSAAAESGAVGTAVGDTAPNFQTFTANGQQVELAELRGQTVLLNFWATWCGPCRIEMPEFQQAYEAYADEGFVIVAVNNQETSEQVNAFGEELGLTFPLAMDLRGSIQEIYGVRSYPSTYLIDENGVIIERHPGVLNVERIEAMIAEAMG